MNPETQRAEQETASGTNPQACPSCGAALAGGLRFCRACGYRLGEGMAEYVETVRFDRMAGMAGMAQGNQGATAATGAPTTVISPLAPAQPQPQDTNPRRRRRGRKWLALALIVLLFIPLAVIGGRFLFHALRNAAQQSFGQSMQERNQPRSFLGESEFGDVEGLGAIFEGTLPDSPAERAGFLDGDIITKFDGKTVNGQDAIYDALRETPIGKTVEVVVLRDGETKTLQLTTISNEDYDTDKRLPKERGLLGIDETERVSVEGTKIHGVRLGEVLPNRPADLAGLKEGDVVVEFGDKPVRTAEGLEVHIILAKPGSTVPIVVMRDGQRVTVDVKMGRRR